MFFAQGETSGWSSVPLPVGSYLNLVPRLIACALDPIPWEWTPLAYNLAAAALTAAIALRVLVANIPPAAAWVGAIAVVAVPSAGEQFLNLCCLHFILAILIAVNLLEPPPTVQTAWRRGAEMTLAALSGPEVLVLAPLSLAAAWRWRRERAAWWCLAALWAGALVQVGMILAQPRASSASTLPPFPLVRLYTEVFFLGWTRVPPAIAWAIATAVTGLIGALAWRNRYWPVAVMLAMTAIFFLMAARSVTVGWPNPYGNGTRYAYPPFVLAAWALGWLLAGAADRARQAIAFALLALVAASSATRWIGNIAPNLHWAQQVAEARNGARETFQIPGPVVWEFAVPRPATP